MVSKDTYRAVASAIRTNGLGNVLSYLESNVASEKKGDEAKAILAIVNEPIKFSGGSFALDVFSPMQQTRLILEKLRTYEILAPEGVTKLFKP